MNGIVAAETGPGGLQLYRHAGDSFAVEEVPFSPFVLLSAAAAIPDNCRIEELAGSGEFCRMAFFGSRASYDEQLGELKKTPGVMVFRDLVQSALSITGVRLFREMDFAGLRIAAFAVSAGENGEISSISAADSNGGRYTFAGDEAESIREFVRWIKNSDPDVLTGFNCCREDLPLLSKRAKKHRIHLDCGRDGSGFQVRNSRYSAGEKQYSYQRFSLAGRHVADMLHILQLYDASHRDMEDMTLVSVQEYFNISGGFVPQIILDLAGILLPAYFYRTRELPLGFQECLLRGSGGALDALLTACYLEKRFSIPLPEAPRPYAGAMAGMENSGVFHHVRHCDVRSLYPSLLLAGGQAPARDEANVFLPLLSKLRDFRLAAKDRAKTASGSERQQLESLQSSFKILINSFYGYLGFAQGSFNDFALAAKITEAGRKLLGSLVDVLQKHGATVIEMDTDGIYFQHDQADGSAIDAALDAVLPEGITLEFDAVYPAMYSYKAKNYALLKSDNTISLTGAALKSRALEPFQRKFIMDVVSSRLHDTPESAIASYNTLYEAIKNRTIALDELAKSEVLSDSPENYRRKIASGSGRRSAAYELALASGREFRAGDRVRFYVTGTKAKVPVTGNSSLLENAPEGIRNENSAYYLAKLEALAETFGVKK